MTEPDYEYLTGCAPIIGTKRGYCAPATGGWSLDAPEAIPHGGTVQVGYSILWREPETLEPDWF